jgi:hypothetical protein
MIHTFLATEAQCRVDCTRITAERHHRALADCHSPAIDAGTVTLNIGPVRCADLSGKNAMNRRLSAHFAITAIALGVIASLGACSSHKARPKADLAASKVTTIGVNSYLWRATLETISFMPLVQTDSNGGVIVTDWYANPNAAGERMKLTVSILDQDLRADAVRVAASRQVQQNGLWVDAPVQAATVQKLEEIILTKARDLRRQAISAG